MNLHEIATSFLFALPDVSEQAAAIVTDIEGVMTSLFPAVVTIVGIRKVGSFAIGLFRGA